MTDKSEQWRTELGGKLTDVLNSRTLIASHPRLGEILKEGMSVLDVGCGTGAIARGIAEAVGPSGLVVGVDSNPNLIDKASQAQGNVARLTFETRDIYRLDYEQQFDIVTCARVMVWLPDPVKALHQMKLAVKPGGRLVIADYNHEKISWIPQPPASMLSFYSAYLNWREDAGLNNQIADHLPGFMKEAGLSDITITPCHEDVRRTDSAYSQRISLWADTASSRGPQMERDGFISKEEYIRAEQEYREWALSDEESVTMYMLTVEGVRK